jgi:hypothetical protein
MNSRQQECNSEEDARMTSAEQRVTWWDAKGIPLHATLWLSLVLHLPKCPYCVQAVGVSSKGVQRVCGIFELYQNFPVCFCHSVRSTAARISAFFGHLETSCAVHCHASRLQIGQLWSF